MLIRKATGEKEEFDEHKLIGSLNRAGATDKETKLILEHITKEVRDGDTTQEIYRHAHELLKKEGELGTAARYALRRAILDLGPSGYPFETFLGELFKAEGYESQVSVELKGKCIKHEVDVVATKEDSLVLVEAKFHNKPGFKTDVKVAMYVESRFRDLSEGGFAGLVSGSQKPTCMLVTNTKFSKNAIKFGNCTGLELLGWDYPRDNNIQDKVEKLGLYPLTVLSTLNKEHNKALFEQGLVLCKSITGRDKELKSLGLNESQIAKVMGEVDKLCPV